MDTAPHVEVRVQQRFSAPAERVFNAWVDPATRGQMAVRNGVASPREFEPHASELILPWAAKQTCSNFNLN
jgi:uncharacterized protein YndB with AHSA1/START domain